MNEKEFVYRSSKNNTFGKNLCVYRTRLGMEISDLSEASGIDENELQKYEEGSAFPDMKTIKLLAKILGVRITDFLVSKIDSILPMPKQRKN